MSSNKNRFSYKSEIDTICTNIIYAGDVSLPDKTMITGIQNFGSRVGWITRKQISQVGRCSKKYLQNGKYKQHNWW